MTRIYDIGPFRLDSETGVLTKAGVPAALGSRAVAVLAALLERAHQCVPKGSIMDAAWPGVVVEESNLAVQISAIRRVLAQASGGERWIETLTGRGYRFVGPVTERLDDRHGGWSGRRSNVPEPLTSFIGRERELVEIKRLLPSKRLVTIVGVGGIGKTRLALQAAAEVIDAYGDGVWLAELGSIRDPSLVPTSVAQSLGVQERSGTPVTESLRAHLKSRQVMVVLDNCEHLQDACAQLADAVLGEAKDATILATSREPLRVAGEQIYALQPLSLPELGSRPETMRQSEAVQLFVERVQRQLPDFELTSARAPAVAELCIHLDGIPLALELAAARARSLSIEQINARLGDRFRLLTGGSRTALPRQQTLRATLDWSYDLLAEAERMVLRRLSIFPGSFTVDAASALASDATIDEFAVIDLLSQLVARSLVIADTSGAETRYHLLETTRAYALEKLAEVGETDAIKRRHAQYFRDLFECATDDWCRMPDAEWRSIYTPEIDNVRTALEWAFGTDGDPAVGVGLCGGSGAIWLELSLHREGAQHLEVALANMAAQSPEFEEARLWFWGSLLWSYSTPAKEVTALERAVELYRRVGDAVWLGYSLARLGSEFAFAGRCEEALAPFAEALPLLECAGRPKLVAEYFLGVGYRETLSGHLDSARLHYEKAASLCREAGAERLAIGVLQALAEMDWGSGNLDAALAGLREASVLARNLGRRVPLGQTLTNLAGALTERGQLAEALSAAREGLPLRNEAGQGWLAIDHLALRTALAGKITQATRLAGFADYAFNAKGATRQPNEARAHDRLHALLRDKLAPDALERLLVEGAKMSEDEACRLALEE